ncbi:hypothetical protein JKY72_02865 [Candidatus Gracilibacteria bacterium]|nr:hypothetical protein [Candidatus Gracilibacteria bacterium]
MEIGINSNGEGPKIAALSVQPLMNVDLFRQMTMDLEVLIYTTVATGAFVDNLVPVIEEMIARGAAVFIIADGKDDHGILRAGKYDAGLSVYKAGAIPIQKISEKNGQQLLDAILEEWANGLRGAELSRVIDKRFSYTREEIEAMGHLRPIQAYYRGKYWDVLDEE